MVYWVEGALREIAGKGNVRPLFLLNGFFCLVGILGYGSVVCALALMDWEGKESWACLFSTLVVSSLMVI